MIQDAVQIQIVLEGSNLNAQTCEFLPEDLNYVEDIGKFNESEVIIFPEQLSDTYVPEYISTNYNLHEVHISRLFDTNEGYKVFLNKAKVIQTFNLTSEDYDEIHTILSIFAANTDQNNGGWHISNWQEKLATKSPENVLRSISVLSSIVHNKTYDIDLFKSKILPFIADEELQNKVNEEFERLWGLGISYKINKYSFSPSIIDLNIDILASKLPLGSTLVNIMKQKQIMIAFVEDDVFTGIGIDAIKKLLIINRSEYNKLCDKSFGALPVFVHEGRHIMSVYVKENSMFYSVSKNTDWNKDTWLEALYIYENDNNYTKFKALVDFIGYTDYDLANQLGLPVRGYTGILNGDGERIGIHNIDEDKYDEHLFGTPRLGEGNVTSATEEGSAQIVETLTEWLLDGHIAWEEIPPYFQVQLLYFIDAEFFLTLP